MIFKRVTLHRLARALERCGNRRVYAFSWGRLSILVEGKAMLSEIIRSEDLFGGER